MTTKMTIRLLKRNRMEYEHHVQPFEPVFDEHSRILILGSFPSVKSRAAGFYYGHRQNRFWRVTAAVFEDAVPETIAEKKQFLLRNGIAIWDVIESCDIAGSSDSKVKNAVAADIPGLLEKTKIRKIYVNGSLAKTMYDRYAFPVTGIEAIKLPSTSPANAAFGLDRLIEEWKMINDQERNRENG